MNHPEISGQGQIERPGQEPLTEDQVKKIARLQELTLRKLSPADQAKLLADKELVGIDRQLAEQGFVRMSDEEAKRLWLNYTTEGKMRKTSEGEITEREGIVNDLALGLSISPERVEKIMTAIENGEENLEG